MKKTMKKQNFTLLELLIVVAILAIIGGGLIAAYDGLESQAARGVATRDIAALDQAFRTHKVTEGTLPNNLETLLSADPGVVNYDSDLVDNIATAVTGTPTKATFLTSKISGKFSVATLTSAQVKALDDAGIDTFRFLESTADDEVDTDVSVLTAAGGDAAGSFGKMSEISIPQHAFDVPRGADKNRGRGFAVDLSDLSESADAAGVAAGLTWDGNIGLSVNDENGNLVFDEDEDRELAVEAAEEAIYTTANLQLAVWSEGGDGYNNIKVGADKDAVLVMLGIGRSSSLVGEGTYTNLAHAPFYGDTLKHEYSHYIALIDVNQSPAKFIAVVDARGDFLDEEFAEATGQKR